MAQDATPTPTVVSSSVERKVGPHPGYISTSSQYISEQSIRRSLLQSGSDAAREEQYRNLGVQLIDNVRLYLHLPVRTYCAACVYFHKFRLNFRDVEYNYQDAALAALLVACKVEDTIKKSKEILCAAYNFKNPEKPVTQDDKIFLSPADIIIGLERLILETIGFDFRTRHPQRLLAKTIRLLYGSDPDADELYRLAYTMSVDLYKTFAPIKQSSFTMVLALVKLSALLMGRDCSPLDSVDHAAWHTTPAAIVETVLDLLDLYTHTQRTTKVGPVFDQTLFLDVKLRINADLDALVESGQGARYADWCAPCEDAAAAAGDNDSPNTVGLGIHGDDGTAKSPSSSVRRTARGQNSTIRFVFDADRARRELAVSGEFFKEEYDEYEEWVDEPIALPSETPPLLLTPQTANGGGGRQGPHKKGHGSPPTHPAGNRDSGKRGGRNRNDGGRFKGRRNNHY